MVIPAEAECFCTGSSSRWNWASCVKTAAPCVNPTYTSFSFGYLTQGSPTTWPRISTGPWIIILFPLVCMQSYFILKINHLLFIDVTMKIYTMHLILTFAALLLVCGNQSCIKPTHGAKRVGDTWSNPLILFMTFLNKNSPLWTAPVSGCLWWKKDTLCLLSCVRSACISNL